MSRKSIIRAEDLHDTSLEAYPYFPVDALLTQGGIDDGEDSVASDLDDAEASDIPVEQRIVERLQKAEEQATPSARASTRPTCCAWKST
jgi:hypothetical protein